MSVMAMTEIESLTLRVTSNVELELPNSVTIDCSLHPDPERWAGEGWLRGEVCTVC